jgi:hypothetical protein
VRGSRQLGDIGFSAMHRRPPALHVGRRFLGVQRRAIEPAQHCLELASIARIAHHQH